MGMTALLSGLVKVFNARNDCTMRIVPIRQQVFGWYASDLLCGNTRADEVPDGHHGVRSTAVRTAHCTSWSLTDSTVVIFPARTMEDVPTPKTNNTITSVERGPADTALCVEAVIERDVL